MISDGGRAVKALVRQHQEAIWSLHQTTSQLRSVLLEFYPQALQRTAGHDGDRPRPCRLRFRPPARLRVTQMGAVRSVPPGATSVIVLVRRGVPGVSGWVISFPLAPSS